MSANRRYWLLKSEPDTFSFDELWAALHHTTCWDVVRNYQPRNFVRDHMKLGDGVLSYREDASGALGMRGAREGALLLK